MKNAASAHPHRDQLEAYGLGKTPPERALEIERHLMTCAECCQVVKDVPGDSFIGQVRAAQALRAPSNEALTATKAYTPAAPTATGSGVSGGNTLPEAATASFPLPPELAKHPRYRVRALLGQGGMGAVYKAEHKMMERCVALKTIGRDLDARPELVERFRRPAHSTAVAACCSGCNDECH